MAQRGALWFLGEIYDASQPGWYFGVPLSNLAGWFLVPLAVIAFNLLLWHLGPRFFQVRFYERTNVPTYKRTDLLYPAFYVGIALFNIGVTFWIGAWRLGLCSSGILLLIVIALITRGTKSQIQRSKI